MLLTSVIPEIQELNQDIRNKIYNRHQNVFQIKYILSKYNKEYLEQLLKDNKFVKLVFNSPFYNNTEDLKDSIDKLIYLKENGIELNIKTKTQIDDIYTVCKQSENIEQTKDLLEFLSYNFEITRYKYLLSLNEKEYKIIKEFLQFESFYLYRVLDYLKNSKIDKKIINMMNTVVINLRKTYIDLMKSFNFDENIVDYLCDLTLNDMMNIRDTKLIENILLKIDNKNKRFEFLKKFIDNKLNLSIENYKTILDIDELINSINRCISTKVERISDILSINENIEYKINDKNIQLHYGFLNDFKVLLERNLYLENRMCGYLVR